MSEWSVLAIPDYQTLMLPFLLVVGDSQDHVVNDIVDKLADEFRLTEEERTKPFSTGEPIFKNRVWWARSYLVKAGLLQSPGRGRIRITTRGLEALKKEPALIDNEFLKQYPEFLEFKYGMKRVTEDETVGEEEKESRTPQEIIELNHRRLRETLAQDLLEKVSSCSPTFFEKLVVDLLVRMGYGGSREDAGQAIGPSREVGGVDGVIKEDKLGLDVVYIQAKRWKDSVGLPIVSQFSGSLDKAKATKGVLITTS